MRAQVHFGGERRHTETVPDTLSPIFEETMAFDFKITSPYQLDASSLLIEVWDSDRLSDELVGCFELDVGEVWRRPDHEMWRQWVALVDTTGTYEGVQGYFRLSVSVLPEGFELKTTHDEVDDDELVDVLMAPAIEMVGAELRLNCYRAEDLPDLDDLAATVKGKGSGCDPFLSVAVAGNDSAKTAVRTGTTAPEWNETVVVPIMLPKHGPPTSDRVRLGVWDHDVAAQDDRIGAATIRLGEVARGEWQDPCWINLYGAPRAVSSAGDARESKGRGFFGGLRDLVGGDAGNVAKAMDSGATEGSAYRGRVLLSASITEHVAEPKLLCNGAVELPPGPTSKYEFQNTERFCLRLFVLEGNGLPAARSGFSLPGFGKGGTHVAVSMGMDEDATEAQPCEAGRCRWYSELELTVDYPDDVTQMPDVIVQLMSGKDRLW